MDQNLRESFLALVRQGIGHDTKLLFKYIDWKNIKTLADKQGLTAIVLDGIGRSSLESTNTISSQFKLNWIGQVIKNYEQRFELYKQTIAEMAGYYNAHGFKMMVIKGYACSLCWPRPEHRPCGDIDIWQFGNQKEADKLLQEEKSIKVDNSHHHHTVFRWKIFSVENHYDFVNVHYNKSNAEIEKEFKKLGNDDTHYVDVLGEKVYIPSPNLHALFLLRHNMVEFASSGITLRNVLDWAFFVKAHGKEVDWDWLESELDYYGMKRLYNIFNAICVGDLGFDVNIFTEVQFDPDMKERVLNEILNPAVPNEKPKFFFLRIFWKYRRWKSNEWKYRLVYKESMERAFWSGVWNHLLKPASI